MDESALVDLLRLLAARGYVFVTPNLSTHGRITKLRGARLSRDLRGVFGWNLPFQQGDLDGEVVDLMRRGGVLRRRGLGLRSGLRVATLDGRPYFHSAYPPSQRDAVFFGPDSYRFAAFIRREMPSLDPGARIVDIGAGAGVGGLFAAGLAPQARVVLTDINPKALSLARINAAFDDTPVELIETAGLKGVAGAIDLVIANPPFMAGKVTRIYRDGGGALGADLSVAWAREAMARLKPGGRMLLYTGSAIVGGEDPLRAELESACKTAGCALTWREIDPDIFGNMLLLPAYRDVERIAAVGAVLTKT